MQVFLIQCYKTQKKLRQKPQFFLAPPEGLEPSTP